MRSLNAKGIGLRRICLISCVKRKAPSRCKAEHLYQSDLFRKCLAYARSLSPNQIYVLSAKYGLLGLDEEIEPYDETLNKMPIASVKIWADSVIEQLRSVSDVQSDHFVFLASHRYRRFLMPHLASHEVPMEELGIGKQLRFLKDRVK